MENKNFVEDGKEKATDEKKIRSSVLLDKDLKDMLDRSSISISHATTFGARFLLAEDFLMDYPSCRHVNNMIKLQERITNMGDELHEMKLKLKKLENGKENPQE